MVLKAYWPLDETSGSTAYDARNSNNGSLNGGVTQNVSGLFGSGAYSFDGTDDYVDAGSNSDIEPSTVSISAWIKTSGGHGGTYPRYAGNNWSFAGYNIQPSSGSVAMEIGDGSSSNTLSASTGIEDGSWHQVTATYRGTDNSWAIYVDAVQENSGTSSYSLAYGGNPFIIGANPSKSDGFANADICNIRIYDHVLTEQEVSYLYSVGQRGLHTSDIRTL
ncbi:LamG domain-containing protein [Candidatus Nanosalina sp. VS9-1]|uniref:LamG domain-containing protein n=1 Tax=Candidatus Nanosalina sp. VS9-1 TaxID=3388566 RepID=UPI0039E06020